MTSVVPSRADANRQAAAVNLVEKHLSARDAHVITARVNASGVNTWLVNGHVVTLEPFATCDCADQANRHPEGGCKHIRAARLLAGQAPAPAAEWSPRGGWLSDQKRPRTEWEEGV